MDDRLLNLIKQIGFKPKPQAGLYEFKPPYLMHNNGTYVVAKKIDGYYLWLYTDLATTYPNPNRLLKTHRETDIDNFFIKINEVFTKELREKILNKIITEHGRENH